MLMHKESRKSELYFLRVRFILFTYVELSTIALDETSINEIIEDQDMGDLYIGAVESMLANQNIQTEALNEYGFTIMQSAINAQLAALREEAESEADQQSAFTQTEGLSGYSVEKCYESLSHLIKGGSDTQRKNIPDLIKNLVFKSIYENTGGETLLVETETFELEVESFLQEDIYNKTIWSLSSSLNMPPEFILPSDSTSTYALQMIHWIDSPFLSDAQIPQDTNVLVNMTSISLLDASTLQEIGINDLEQPANLTFYIQEENSIHLNETVECAYYDAFSAQYSTEGLTIPETGIVVYEGRTSLVTCELTHFSDFTVLFTYKDIQDIIQQVEEEEEDRTPSKQLSVLIFF
jgi:hypothetical protein